MQAGVKLHNHFLAELTDVKTGETWVAGEAENVVTNEGRKSLANNYGLHISGNYFMGECYVGSGTATPAPTDATLGLIRALAELATTAQVGSYATFQADEVNAVWWHRHKYQFSETVANYDLTEVGLGPDTSPAGVSSNATSNLTTHTRALFKDANGNPITVTKTGSQILTITATAYLQRGAVDTNMRLLDKWFTKQVSGGPDATYSSWLLGAGTTPPTNADTGLSGAEIGRKSGSIARQNGVYWDGANSVWTTIRPAGKQYVTTWHVDFQLAESNGTYSEVVAYEGASISAANAAMRLVYPCGTVAEASKTKTDQEKVRHYFELVWQ